MSYTPRPDETIEDLQLNGLRLIQKKDAFRFGMDSVLLADFADIRPTDTAADLGTGNGALIFLLYGRGKGKRYYAIDIQQEAASLAARNAELNSISDKVSVICADVKDAPKYIEPCSVDAAVCNPPYGQPAASLPSPFETKAVARSQGEETLDNLLKGAFRILKGKGKLYMVYPAPQMLFLMAIPLRLHLSCRFLLFPPWKNSRPQRKSRLRCPLLLHCLFLLRVFDQKRVLNCSSARCSPSPPALVRRN